MTKAEWSVSSGKHKLLKQHEFSMWSDVLLEEVQSQCNGRTGREALTTTEGLGSPMGGSGFAADPKHE